MKILLLNLALLCAATLAPAQVTIGSSEKPAPGALLDLKQEGITEKGLGMPRVELTDLAPTTNADLAKSIGNTTGSYDMAEHVGLIIYNVKPGVFDPLTCKTEGGPGLYVWEGTKWQGLGTGGGTKDPLESETAITLTDRDGNIYPISTFGTAGTWMTENLRTTTAPGLTAMTESAASSYTDMHYAYPNGGSPYTGKPGTWTAQQGLIYNWQATMNKITCNISDQRQVAGSTPGANEVETTDGFIQGICPFGWHVPSDRELNQLEKEIATKASLYSQSTPDGTWTAAWETTAGRHDTIHSKAMKSTTPLNGIATNGDSKPATAGGFDMLLVGFAIFDSASNFGTDGDLWSASGFSTGGAFVRVFINSGTQVGRGADMREALFSVRCKKD